MLFFYSFIGSAFIIEGMVSMLLAQPFIPLTLLSVAVNFLRKSPTTGELVYGFIILGMSTLINQISFSLLATGYILSYTMVPYRTIIQPSCLVISTLLYLLIGLYNSIIPLFAWTLVNSVGILIVLPVMVSISMKGMKDNRV